MPTIQATQNRITIIDALRGFALLVILIVNIFVFHAPYAHYGEFKVFRELLKFFILTYTQENLL